jgi:hypothetical protein
VLVLDMIEILPPLKKYKYDTWKILPVKCYIDNSVHLRSYIRNVNTHKTEPPRSAIGRLGPSPPALRPMAVGGGVGGGVEWRGSGTGKSHR